MILYEKDFAEYNATLHLNTTNVSFIRMAKLLKDLGIKNNKFFLALLDRDIANYDPHNLTDPSMELRLRIGIEAKRNIWYALREVIRVPESGGDGLTQYALNRLNLAITWCTFNNFDSFSTVIRQVGKTTAVLSIDAALMYLMETNYQSGFVSKDSDGVQDAVKRMKRFRDGLPEFLVHKSYRDKDNEEGLSYLAFNNLFRTFIGQKSKQEAIKKSRGLSMPKQDYDEIAFTDNIDTIFPSAVASTTASREQVMRKGGIGPICVTTTAGDPTTIAGGFAYAMKNKCMRFQDKFYDCKDRSEVTEILKSGSPREMFYILYNHLQLGKTDEWLQVQIIRTESTEEQADRDYRSIWRRSGTQGAIPKDIMNCILASEMDPLHTEIVDNLVFNYYVPYETLEDNNFYQKPLVLGNDGSENIEKDYTTLWATDPLTMEPVFSFRCNTSNLNSIAKHIFLLLKRYPRMIYVPERNHVGAMIVDTVIDLLVRSGIDPFNRIYNTIINDAPSISAIAKPDMYDITGAIKGKFGFRTGSGKTGRTMLYSTTFKKALDICKHKIKDHTLVDQLRDLSVKNGRIDHPVGKHDDMVISWLLSCYFILFANNIQMYGIQPHEIIDLDVVSVDGTQETKEAIKLNKQDYLAYIREIKELEIKLENCSIPMIKLSLEAQIKVMRDMIQQYNITEEVVTKQQLIEDSGDKYGVSSHQAQQKLHSWIRSMM